MWRGAAAAPGAPSSAEASAEASAPVSAPASTQKEIYKRPASIQMVRTLPVRVTVAPAAPLGQSMHQG
jgi:hypothetical protein